MASAYSNIVEQALSSGHDEAAEEIKQVLAAGGKLRAKTQPYRSYARLSGVVVDADAANGEAFAKFGVDTKADFFSYGVGGQIPTGLKSGTHAASREATECDTNLVEANKTVGGELFVIDSMSAGQTDAALEYTDADLTTAAFTDSDVLDALRGGPNGASLYDPSANASVIELWGPLYGENVLWSALAPHCDVIIRWDRDQVEHLGTLEQFFCGSGMTYLRSNGEPNPLARFMLPEGRIWRPVGARGTHTLFSVELRVRRAVVVPISLSRFKAATSGNYPIPQTVHCGLTWRVHGLSVLPRSPSSP